jgi:hypothetical protein
MTTERTGLMIIRAWVEEGSSAPLRAEISMTADVAIGMERTSVHSDVIAVGSEVQTWLQAILGSPERQGP